MKKKYLSTLILWLLAFFPSLINAQAWWQNKTYQATESTILQAYIDIYDDAPPSPPELITPPHEAHLCDPYPVFSFKEATDDHGIASYTFSLQGLLSNKKTFSFIRTFTGEINTYDYQVWFENGIYYVKLKQPLDWGIYEWQVTATDTSGYESQSAIFHFYLLEEECLYDCELLSLMPLVKLIAPQGKIDNHNPALIFSYPPGGLPVRADIYVDGKLVFANISFINQHTSQYTVVIDTTKRQVLIQPLLPYLPEKDDNPATYTIKAIVTDEHNCSAETDTNVIIISEIPCTVQALIPYLLSPTIDYVSNTAPQTFIWDICTHAINITEQKFILNGIEMWTLRTGNLDNDDFNFRVEHLGPSACGPETLRFYLTLKKKTYHINGVTAGIRYNDPFDLNDWNRWAITVTGCNDLTVTSSIRRFRYLPEVVAPYSWCTDQQTCVTGTLTECLNANRHCYYQNYQLCLSNAMVDCDLTPPERKYYWCINQSQCVSGTLAECRRTGKNCYLHESSEEGDGCLQRAKYDCAPEMQYYWCLSPTRCALGSFSECLASGKPCYRQEAGMTSCPAYVLADCQLESGLLVNNPFARKPKFLPDPLALLSALGLPENLIKFLEVLATQIFPFVSLLLLLPIGLLIIFFPRPRGLVFDSKSRKAIADAIVAVIREGKFITASFTNKNGFFTGFKLTPGEYYLQVSSAQYLYPSQKKRSERQSIQNFYLADKFYISSSYDKMITYQIPMDLDLENYPKEEPKENQFNLKWRILRLLSSLINALGLLWGITFALAIIFTLIYPIWLNILILAVYIYGLIRRIMAGVRHFNITGKIINQKEEPVADIPLYLHLVTHDRLVAQTLTDEHGNFVFHAHPRYKYYLQTLHFNFVEQNQIQERLYFDLNKRKISLIITIKEKENV